MNSKNDIVGILLAAGQSHRFGSNKLLHKISGEAMATLSARHLKAALPNTVAILKPNDQQTQAVLKNEGLVIVECPHAKLGMGHSLAYAISQYPQAKGWVIALADMPFIDQKTIFDVAAAIQTRASISIPVYMMQRGHPVGFSQHFRKQLLSLNNDKGAKEIINQNKTALVEIKIDDPGVLIDIDTLPSTEVNSTSAISYRTDYFPV